MVNTNNVARPQAIGMCTSRKMKFHDPFTVKLILAGDWAMITQKTIGIKIKQPSMLWCLPLSLEAPKKLMEESQSSGFADAADAYDAISRDYLPVCIKDIGLQHLLNMFANFVSLLEVMYRVDVADEATPVL